MERDILVKWYLQHSPDKVWECLTNPELLNKWFMENDFKAVKGHKFQFKNKPKVKVGWDGIVYAEVLEVIPEKYLSYSWKGGPRPGVISLDSVVTYTLTPKGEGTEVVIEHKGFKGWKNYISSIIVEKGWKSVVPKKFARVLDEFVNAR